MIIDVLSEIMNYGGGFWGNVAEKIPGMDPEKAYIVGLLHDIGRRVKFGFVDIPTHVYEGYKYCMEKGWDEAARICMTHSYLLMQDEFDYEPETENEKAIKAYIMDCTAYAKAMEAAG